VNKQPSTAPKTRKQHEQPPPPPKTSPAHAEEPTERLLRLTEVLKLIPVSKSTWWNGVRTGKFPRPVKLGERTTCWRHSDIVALIQEAIRMGHK
ncbi:MAG: AlpA family phage regulatory protein, partial [Syntrophobacteraceae bacterium]